MPKKPALFYYVHHHGNGHAALFNMLLPALLQSFDVHVFIADARIKKLLQGENISIHILPTKYPSNYHYTHTFSKAFEGIPHAPQSAERILFLSALYKKYTPRIFISDGSAELVITARLLGMKVVFNRLLGKIQQDPTQLFAYACADHITAFFPQELEMKEYKYTDKTTYYGFLSKYNDYPHTNTFDKTISIIVGSSGPSIETLKNITANKNYDFKIIGLTTPYDFGEHVDVVGKVKDISRYIPGRIVITSAGLNTVSELVALQKKIVTIPEERPYDEQQSNAQQLEHLHASISAQHDASTKDWLRILQNAEKLTPTLQTFSSETIINAYSKNIKELYATV